MTKKKSSEILGVKMDIFSGKNRHFRNFGPRRFFPSPPKLGARSQNLVNEWLIKDGWSKDCWSWGRLINGHFVKRTVRQRMVHQRTVDQIFL